MLNMVDEFTHECFAIRVARKLTSTDVIDALSDLFILRGVPGHIRFDNSPEFIAKAVQGWIAAVGAKTAYIAPGSPWENGYNYSARILTSHAYGAPRSWSAPYLPQLQQLVGPEPRSATKAGTIHHVAMPGRVHYPASTRSSQTSRQ